MDNMLKVKIDKAKFEELITNQIKEVPSLLKK